MSNSGDKECVFLEKATYKYLNNNERDVPQSLRASGTSAADDFTSLRATGVAIQRKTAQAKILEWWQQIIE